jgi:hypothetical protein
MQALQRELQVRQVGTLVVAVPDPAVELVGRLVALSFVRLAVDHVVARALDQRSVTRIAQRAERHDGDRCVVDRQVAIVDRAVGLGLALQIADTLSDEGSVVLAVSARAAGVRGQHERRDARVVLPRAVVLLLLAQPLQATIDRPADPAAQLGILDGGRRLWHRHRQAQGPRDGQHDRAFRFRQVHTESPSRDE